MFANMCRIGFGSRHAISTGEISVLRIDQEWVSPRVGDSKHEIFRPLNPHVGDSKHVIFRPNLRTKDDFRLVEARDFRAEWLNEREFSLHAL